MRLNVRFETDIETAIAAEAERTGSSMAEVVRACVCEVLLVRRGEKIGTMTERLIREGLTNAEVLERVREVHGQEASSKDSVAWYRSRLRRDDPTVLTEREARLDRL